MNQVIENKSKRKIAIIGAGVIGCAVGFLLKKAGHEIAGIISRTEESAKRGAAFVSCWQYGAGSYSLVAKADTIFITTPDRAIGGVCEEIARSSFLMEKTILIHMSGALPSTILKPATRSADAMVLSLHPLQSFAELSQAVKNLPGSYFTIEGDNEALPIGRSIISDLGGLAIEITPQAKPLYHAGACVASNFLVSLVDLSLELFCAINLSKEEALKALLPLIKGTLDNIEKIGPTQALTGPISRGDCETVSMHLEAMKEKAPTIIPLYIELGMRAMKIAAEKGSLSREDALRLKSVLDKYILR